MVLCACRFYLFDLCRPSPELSCFAAVRQPWVFEISNEWFPLVKHHSKTVGLVGVPSRDAQFVEAKPDADFFDRREVRMPPPKRRFVSFVHGNRTDDRFRRRDGHHRVEQGIRNAPHGGIAARLSQEVRGVPAFQIQPAQVVIPGSVEVVPELLVRTNAAQSADSARLGPATGIKIREGRHENNDVLPSNVKTSHRESLSPSLPVLKAFSRKLVLFAIRSWAD